MLVTISAQEYAAKVVHEDEIKCQRVLEDTAVTPDERIDQLWKKTSEANREVVEQDYDAGAWGTKPVKDGKSD